MTAVKPDPTSLEDISAGLLNGAMVTLLAGLFACVLGWQIVAESTGWLPDLKAMTIDARPALARVRFVDLGLLVAAIGFIWRGVVHIRKNLALLRARRA